MPTKVLFSIIESPKHPKLSALFSRLGFEEVQLTSTRKAVSQLKKQVPDVVVADFVYGYRVPRQSMTKPHSERPKCSGARRSAQGMVSPCQALQRRAGAFGTLPPGGWLSGHPRCCGGLA
jgi:hypothetical protein